MRDYKRIGYDSYFDYLGSRHWQHIRRMYWMSGQDLECKICHSIENLVLHHRRYDTLGDEDIYKDVILVCEICHHNIHFFGDQKTPLEYWALKRREDFLYAQEHTIKKRILRFKLGEFINTIFGYY